MSCYKLIIYWECLECHKSFWSENYEQCACPHCKDGMGIPVMHSLEEVNAKNKIKEENEQ